MKKWTPLPADPLYYQADQEAFLNAKRSRACVKCATQFYTPPHPICPKCGGVGVRLFDKLSIIAGRRFGKSKIGSIAGVEEATIPNTIGWACAPTNPKLHRYVIPAFQQLIPPEWVESWSSEFLDLRLKNGSLIHFQTLEDPDQGRGQGLDWLWIDEVCELTLKHWEVIRPSLAGNTVAFFTTSPRGYDWVYKELYKPAVEGQRGFWACKARSVDSANPKLSAEFLASERATMDPTMYRQEYEADFVNFTGAIYGDLIHTHTLRDADAVRRFIPEWPAIHDWRPCVIGIDTGADHPFGAVKLVATEMGLIAVKDYLERNRSFLEHANELKRLAYPHTAKFSINKNEKQPMIELAQHGVNCQRAENDQLAGVERVKSWLYQGKLWFVEGPNYCDRTIQQMSALRMAENRRTDGQNIDQFRVHKVDDELPDCVRYACMSWPMLPEPRKVSTERDISNMPDEMRWTIERQRRINKPPSDDMSTTKDFWS